jgi:hypothetical protein
MLPGRGSGRRGKRVGARCGRGPAAGAEYRLTLAWERALLGWVRTCLVLLVTAVSVWAYPQTVAHWARGFLAYYLTGLGAGSAAVALVLATHSHAPDGGEPGGWEASAFAILLLAAAPVLAAVVC